MRTALFFFKLGLFMAVAVWVADKPGTMRLEWLGYTITLHIGIFLLFLLFIILLTTTLYRGMYWLKLAPKRLKRAMAGQREEKGMKHLTTAMAAYASGDLKLAEAYTRKSGKLLPADNALHTLLSAQLAHARGDTETYKLACKKLTENESTSIYGVRGILMQSMAEGNLEQAKYHADEAMAQYPKQAWAVRSLYAIQVRERNWNAARDTLKRAVRQDIIGKAEADTERAAMFIEEGDKAYDSGDINAAARLYRKAYAYNKDFLPAALRLASAYLERNQKARARTILEHAWRTSPHPDLVPLWDKLSPPVKTKSKSSAARLKWFSKLLTLAPESAEAHMAAGHAAMDIGLWGEARKYFLKAESIQPSARLYKLLSRLEDLSGGGDTASRAWLERATAAPPEKVWTCHKTGRIYERWLPIAQPHGAFNSIDWGYPIPNAVFEVPQLKSA